MNSLNKETFDLEILKFWPEVNYAQFELNFWIFEKYEAQNFEWNIGFEKVWNETLTDKEKSRSLQNTNLTNLRESGFGFAHKNYTNQLNDSGQNYLTNLIVKSMRFSNFFNG